jgi:hypothetical protein
MIPKESFDENNEPCLYTEASPIHNEELKEEQD